MDKFFTGVLYIWRVLWNVVQLAIVLYVFSRLQGRIENILVSILGLIYVTIRTIAFGTWQMITNMAVALDKEFVNIRRLAGEETEWRTTAIDETEKAIKRTTVKLYIDMAFMALIMLVCLAQLFTTLN